MQQRTDLLLTASQPDTFFAMPTPLFKESTTSEASKTNTIIALFFDASCLVDRLSLVLPAVLH